MSRVGDSSQCFVSGCYAAMVAVEGKGEKGGEGGEGGGGGRGRGMGKREGEGGGGKEVEGVQHAMQQWLL